MLIISQVFSTIHEMHHHGVPREISADPLHVMQCNTREKWSRPRRLQRSVPRFAATLKRRIRHARERAAGVDQNKGTVVDTKRLIDRKSADPVVQADMKLWPFKVLSGSGDKTMIQVQSMREERKFHSRVIYPTLSWRR